MTHSKAENGAPPAIPSVSRRSEVKACTLGPTNTTNSSTAEIPAPALVPRSTRFSSNVAT